MITKQELYSMSPIEIEMIHSYINQLYKERITMETENYDNLVGEVTECPYCHSKHIVKNGFNPKKRQKYLCKKCRGIFLPTTKTLFQHSKVGFADWMLFMAGELNGLTLEQQSVATGLTVTTCFSMRHKLYSAVSHIQEGVVLSGDIECDPTYVKINLKGTKPQNMPRISKKRGKHKGSTIGKNLSGISHHKVCIMSAIDDNDNMLFKIAGLGPEDKDNLSEFKGYFAKGSTLITDGKQALINFARDNMMVSDSIPVVANKQIYKTPKGNTLADVNQLHQELATLIYKKHGVSIRHLPDYLNWLVFAKKLRYTVDGIRRRSDTYITVMKKVITLLTRTICKIDMPINLYEAYHEYHYGIFSHQLFA